MPPLSIRFLCLSGNMTEALAFAIATNLNTSMQFGYVAEFENARALSPRLRVGFTSAHILLRRVSTLETLGKPEIQLYDFTTFSKPTMVRGSYRARTLSS